MSKSPIYSYSRLKTFEQCPFKYKLKYIDKVVVPYKKTVEAFVGEIVHKILEILYRKFISEGILLSYNDLLKLYDFLWDINYKNDLLINGNKDVSFYKAQGLKLVSQYYKRNYPFNALITLAVETNEIIELKNDKLYHVKIDRLAKDKDNNFYIIDYKTSNRAKTQDEADEDEQLAMYSLWVVKKFPEAKNVFLVWDFLKFNQTVVSQRTKDQLIKLEDETIKLIDKIENTSEFHPTVSYLCKWCIYKDICPFYNEDK